MSVLTAAKQFMNAKIDELSVVWVNHGTDDNDWENISALLNKPKVSSSNFTNANEL